MKKILIIAVLSVATLGIVLVIFSRSQPPQTAQESIVQPTVTVTERSGSFQSLTTQAAPATNETVFIEQLRELDQEIDELQLVNTELIL